MIIYLYGPDSYRRNKKLKELVDAYKKKNKDADIAEFDFVDNPDAWMGTKDFLNQPSMFRSKKMAVIKNVKEVERKLWIETLKSFLEDDEVFILITDPAPPKKAYKFLLRLPVKSQEFSKLEGENLRTLLAKICKELGVDLSPEANKLLLSFLEAHENRSQLILLEILKVKHARFSQPVSRGDMQSVINWQLTDDLFRATRELIKAKDAPRRCLHLERLFIRNDSGAHIFNLLGYHAKGEELARIADLDVDIKSGRANYEEALLSFAIS